MGKLRVCVRVLTSAVAEADAVDGCTLKSSDDNVDQRPLLGYLAAGSPGRLSLGPRRRHRGHGAAPCGTERSPWLVTARRGQRIRFTLMDFSLSTDELDVNRVGHDAVQSQMMSYQERDGQLVKFRT